MKGAVLDWQERYAATPEFTRTKNHWQVEHQSQAHAPKDPYKLVVHLCLKNLVQEPTSIVTPGFLTHQRQEVALVACIKIQEEPETVFFTPEQFWTGLKPLLDGATRIFCLSQNEFYGHLKATPLDVVSLDHLQQALGPPSRVPDPLLYTDAKDPYALFMNSNSIVLPKPKDIVHPTMPLEVDEDFLSLLGDDAATEARKMHQDEEKKTIAQFHQVNSEAPNELNKMDDEDVQMRYRLVPRWFGPPSTVTEPVLALDTKSASISAESADVKAKQNANAEASHDTKTNSSKAMDAIPGVIKKATVYFPEQVMTMWRFKTTALEDELHLNESKLYDILHHNPPTKFTPVFRDKATTTLDKLLNETEMAALWRKFCIFPLQ